MPHHSDSNAAEIVAALRGAGASVQLIQGANRQAGVPDLLVGFRGTNYLMEVKRPKVGRVSEVQAEWVASWRGHVSIVTTAEMALRVIGLLT